MSAANARDAAETWIAEKAIPEELRGRKVQLAIFTSEENCRFFYPRRALKWQQQVNTYISRLCRGRHAKIERVELTPATYDAWRSEHGRDDGEAVRREYADSFQRLLE